MDTFILICLFINKIIIRLDSIDNLFDKIIACS